MHRKQHDRKRRKWEGRRARVTRRLAGEDHPRLSVYRSAKHIYAQIIDPMSGRTLGTVSSRSKSVMGDEAATGNVEAAKRVGKAVADLARQNSIDRVVFHRNGFLYHGRVKALAEAAREAGLRF